MQFFSTSHIFFLQTTIFFYSATFFYTTATLAYNMTTVIAELKLEPQYYNEDGTQNSGLSVAGRIQNLVKETDCPEDGIQNIGHQTQYH